MDAVDIVAMLTFAAVSCIGSIWVLPARAGAVAGMVGILLVLLQVIYAIATGPDIAKAELHSLLIFNLAPARLGIALGLIVASGWHLVTLLGGERRDNPE